MVATLSTSTQIATLYDIDRYVERMYRDTWSHSYVFLSAIVWRSVFVVILGDSLR